MAGRTRKRKLGAGDVARFWAEVMNAEGTSIP